MQILIDTIEQIKKENPTQAQTVEYYLSLLRRNCAGISKEIVEESCHAVKKGNHYSKGVIYLQAIMKNKMKEDIVKHKKEHDILGSVPLPKF